MSSKSGDDYVSLPGLVGKWRMRRTIVGPVGATPVSIASADMERWLIAFRHPANQVRVSPFGFNPSDNTEPFLTTNKYADNQFKYSDWGFMVQAEWFGLSVGATTSVQVIEIFWKG